ncbi:bacteriorhodopsin [Natronobacterium gregoryi]|uniref:Bacteriorhodopsin n=2 Tax=Natronobacterium gregoryi TaxID=44930 RepID=L0AJU7_NATGS|nr:bacteriorhodopsin [Natronobacterium gregoryi]AFZ74148.1 bacteriorhodopsin [Natronobacterium gregoryi SP2]ELY63603.1 halorhodopsin [Natronobacterium gregoryi SP2]PLK22059.1 capsular biosynthesis protein CpsH [Natronobacterium gregoryi SP2]SFI50335.1 halorhodopsin [Natronobacterium gregoryi]
MATRNVVLQVPETQQEIFEFVFEDTLLALSFVVNIALAGLTILFIVALARGVTDPRAKLIVISTMLISVVSISSYTGLASGLTLSFIEMPAGHSLAGEEVLTMWGRYLTWAFSTPFILIVLGMIAGSNITKIMTTVAMTIAMCVTGLAAALTTSSLLMRWWWFVLSSAFFLVIIYVIMVDWTREADRTGTSDLFTTLKILTVVGWFGYPILWALGVEGFALLEVWMTSWGYSVLDIITKYIVTVLIVLYVIEEPETITADADYGTTLKGVGTPADD